MENEGMTPRLQRLHPSLLTSSGRLDQSLGTLGRKCTALLHDMASPSPIITPKGTAPSKVVLLLVQVTHGQVCDAAFRARWLSDMFGQQRHWSAVRVAFMWHRCLPWVGKCGGDAGADVAKQTTVSVHTGLRWLRSQGGYLHVLCFA